MYKVIIFDLDDVLIHEGFEPYLLCDDVIDVLTYLKNKNYKLAIASHNDDTIEILTKTNLLKYFDYIQGFDDVSKTKHFKNIIDHFKINYNDCYLFDDLQANIDLAERLGIKCKLVNYITGVTMYDIIDF